MNLPSILSVLGRANTYAFCRGIMTFNSPPLGRILITTLISLKIVHLIIEFKNKIITRATSAPS